VPARRWARPFARRSNRTSASRSTASASTRTTPRSPRRPALGARAFAHGNDIFLGAGESADDLALMAHEATHVAQQRPDLVQREVTDYIPDFVLSELRDLASEYDGYDALTVAFGYDPIAGQEVARTRRTWSTRCSSWCPSARRW
jgi:hypothetical protein